MPTNTHQLLLYEALELRAEYDARIQTLKDCLPETKQNRNRLSFVRDEEVLTRPSPDFDVAQARQALRTLEFKRRKLNSAIQQANFAHQIEFRDEAITLSEALELRKGLNEQIGELHAQVVRAAYQRVIYKEGRDIVEPTEVSYTECLHRLEEARLAFRALNRALRAAAYEVVVEFQDE